MEGGEFMRNLINRNGRGFTLIELLVVIAIIGILAAVVLVSLTSARGKARDSRRVSDMRQIQTALELFYNDCGQYPTSLATTANNGCTGGVTLGTFLSTIPGNQTGCTTAGGTAPAGSATLYGYTPTGGTPTSYTIFFCSEGVIAGTPITAAGSGHTATPSGLAN
jgi:prepilin-type N-terminal cleavage/methylation domain-containing protein